MHKRRGINGILLLDKPKGYTSNQALQIVKKLYNAQKAGHTGSLDPLAVGMLPICFGEATKFSQCLLEANKTYHVTARLGIKTTTGDAEGEIVLERAIPTLTHPALEALFAQFTGTVTQIPSMYSALKKDGQPLYKLARQGLEVERKARTIQVHHIEYLRHDAQTFTVNIACSKGTYIRTLIEDMGEALGCGAYVQDLCRLSVGPYAQEKMHTLDELQALAKASDYAALDALLLPLDSAVAHWPEVFLSEAALYYLNKGQAIVVPYAPASGWVRIKRKNGAFSGIGEILDDGKLAPRRLVASG